MNSTPGVASTRAKTSAIILTFSCSLPRSDTSSPVLAISTRPYASVNRFSAVMRKRTGKSRVPSKGMHARRFSVTADNASCAL